MNIWDYITLIKSAYSKCLESVCVKYRLTRMELDILLFLANNPEYDTARDIIEKKRLTKSHVSSSLKSLEEQGYLTRRYLNGNCKTPHLFLCESAAAAIHEGQLGQKLFADTLFLHFSEESKAESRKLFYMVMKNLEEFLEEDSYDL